MFGSVLTSKSTVICDLPVVGVHRIHVVHVVHAADLRFERRGHGLFQRLRVRSGISGLDLDFRRNDVGKLRDGQAQHGDHADDHHEDGDHHRDDRPVDEKFRHSLYLPLAVGLRSRLRVSGCGFTVMPSLTLRRPSEITRLRLSGRCR